MGKSILARTPLHIKTRGEFEVADLWIREAEAILVHRTSARTRVPLEQALIRVRSMRNAYVGWVEERSLMAPDPYKAMIHLIVAHGREMDFLHLIPRLMKGELGYHIWDLQMLYRQFGMDLRVVTTYKLLDAPGHELVTRPGLDQVMLHIAIHKASGHVDLGSPNPGPVGFRCSACDYESRQIADEYAALVAPAEARGS